MEWLGQTPYNMSAVRNRRASLQMILCNFADAARTNQIWVTRDGAKTWSDCSSNYGGDVDSAKDRPLTRFLTFDPSGERVFALTAAGTG